VYVAVCGPREVIVPPPLTLQVTAEQGTGTFVVLSHLPLITALDGTPVTPAVNRNVSPVPMVAVDGVTLKRTPESSVTVAVALLPSSVATLTVTVELGGNAAGA
jgi:hypothetical protein